MIWPWTQVTLFTSHDIDLRYEYSQIQSVFQQPYRTVYFSIYLHDTSIKIGECDLRIGKNEELYYAGNIGYRIYPKFRGHHFAYEVCLLLFQIAKSRYHMKNLIITCSPDNIPSRKTLEKLDGEFLGCVDVPRNHWLYERGEIVKNIYFFNL